jgi:hypothetical protein
MCDIETRDKIMYEVGRYPLLEAILKHLNFCDVLSK